MLQSYALFPNLTIAENVGYGLRSQRRPRQEIAARVGDCSTSWASPIRPLSIRRNSRAANNSA